MKRCQKQQKNINKTKYIFYALYGSKTESAGGFIRDISAI